MLRNKWVNELLIKKLDRNRKLIRDLYKQNDAIKEISLDMGVTGVFNKITIDKHQVSRLSGKELQLVHPRIYKKFVVISEARRWNIRTIDQEIIELRERKNNDWNGIKTTSVNN